MTKRAVKWHCENMRLKKWMEAHGVSQSQLGKKIGASQSAVCRYMSGDRIPRLQHMVRIYRVTRRSVTPNDFYGLGK